MTPDIDGITGNQSPASATEAADLRDIQRLTEQLRKAEEENQRLHDELRSANASAEAWESTARVAVESKLPCGHPTACGYTHDGGKHIGCSWCEEVKGLRKLKELATYFEIDAEYHIMKLPPRKIERGGDWAAQRQSDGAFFGADGFDGVKHRTIGESIERKCFYPTADAAFAALDAWQKGMEG